jgi:hypothetical protein
MPTEYWWEGVKRRNQLKGPGVDGRTMVKCVQDRYQWRALVNTVMKLRVPQKVGNFFKS